MDVTIDSLDLVQSHETFMAPKYPICPQLVLYMLFMWPPCVPQVPLTESPERDINIYLDSLEGAKKIVVFNGPFCIRSV